MAGSHFCLWVEMLTLLSTQRINVPWVPSLVNGAASIITTSLSPDHSEGDLGTFPQISKKCLYGLENAEKRHYIPHSHN